MITDGRATDRPAYIAFRKLVDCKRDNVHKQHTADRRLQGYGLFTSGSSTHFLALWGLSVQPEGPWDAPERLQPALVASRFNESSLSPFARTCPQKAKVVEVGSALPSVSTSTMLICTDAWSLDVINWSANFWSFPLAPWHQAADELVAEHLRGT
jgi:hypothetical protein